MSELFVDESECCNRDVREGTENSRSLPSARLRSASAGMTILLERAQCFSLFQIPHAMYSA